jgi:hypothetical protein
MAKSKSNRTTYANVSKNIQKIVTPAGTINYRVRVGFGGEVLSAYASSLKEAKALRSTMLMGE